MHQEFVRATAHNPGGGDFALPWLEHYSGLSSSFVALTFNSLLNIRIS